MGELQVECKCGAGLRVRPDEIGRRTRCPGCGESLEVRPTFGEFEVIERVGQGGMGAVFKAYDPDLDRHAAVKIIHQGMPNQAELAARFRREARAAARLEHANVVAVHRFGSWEDGHYLAMQWIDGRNLQELLIGEGPLEPQRALGMIRQAAAGLGAAHGQGIWHRDVKPANLMLTAGGQVKVTDFGLARFDREVEAKQTAATELTASGTVLGTPQYLSPEQWESATKVDGRTDIFALGVTLYHLISGAYPFEGDTPPSLMRSTLTEPPTPIGRHRAEIPGGVWRLIERMIAKDPADRFQTMEQVISAIDALEAQPTATAPGRPRRRRLVAGSACALLLLAGAGWWLLRDPGRPEQPQTRPSAPGTARATEVNPAGAWTLHAGERVLGVLHLERQGDRLIGRLNTPAGLVQEVTGSIDGQRVAFTLYEEQGPRRFEGAVSADGNASPAPARSPEVRRARGAPRGEEPMRTYVGVVQPGQRTRLPQKPLGPLQIHPAACDLERHLPLQQGIPGAVDHPHPSPPELVEDPVAPQRASGRGKPLVASPPAVEPGHILQQPALSP